VKLTIYVFFLHFLADFVFQSDWMAQNKSKDWFALFTHVMVYMTVFYLGLVWTFSEESVGLFWGINFLAHFLVDSVTSRINAKLWERKQVHYFFVGVGFDQFIHATTLILTIPCLKLK
jgi:hypothetical protein